MRETTVRTSLDIPINLHRRLHEAAARQGRSARQLILESIQSAIEKASPQESRRRLSLNLPLVPSGGRKPFRLTNAEIYELIELP